MMRVLVTGGRDYSDRATVFRALTRLHRETPIDLVIHGACVWRDKNELRGADRWAQEWALANEVPYLGHPAKWTTLQYGAGPQRNADMLARWKPDIVFAFPGGRGTADMVRKAEVARLRVITIACTRDDVSLANGAL